MPWPAVVEVDDAEVPPEEDPADEDPADDDVDDEDPEDGGGVTVTVCVSVVGVAVDEDVV